MTGPSEALRRRVANASCDHVRGKTTELFVIKWSAKQDQGINQFRDLFKKSAAGEECGMV